MNARRSDTNVPATLAVANWAGGLSGLTVSVAVRDGSTLNSYLDFADRIFKTSGWSMREATLDDLGGGFYALSNGVDLSTIVNLPATTEILFFEYVAAGTENGIGIEEVQLEQLWEGAAASAIADAVWNEQLDAHTDPETMGGAQQCVIASAVEP